MKTITIQIEYFNLKIETSLNLIETIKTMPPALQLETIIDILEIINEKMYLEAFQIAIFKKRVNRINQILSQHH